MLSCAIHCRRFDGLRQMRSPVCEREREIGIDCELSFEDV